MVTTVPNVSHWVVVSLACALTNAAATQDTAASNGTAAPPPAALAKESEKDRATSSEEEAPRREVGASGQQEQERSSRSERGRGYVFQCPGAETARSPESGGSLWPGRGTMPPSGAELQNLLQPAGRQGGDRPPVTATRLHCITDATEGLAGLQITFNTDVSREAAIQCLWGGRVESWRLANRFTSLNSPKHYMFVVEDARRDSATAQYNFTSELASKAV